MWPMMWQIVSRMVFMVLSVVGGNSFPKPLTAKQEREAVAAMAAGDAAARKRLIEHNLRLVAHIIKKHYANARDQEDLISIGTIGLIKAVDTFHVHNGAKFATYAAKCIQNEILMYFRSRKKLAAEVSLNDTIDVDRDGNPLTYIDVISSDECISEDIDRKIKVEKREFFVYNAHRDSIS